MGKKSKVNKLARMSDEERARYLQQRADVEEEARRRKQELIARFIKNKLDREEAYSRINIAKINQGWRFILRKIKRQQMAVDIQAMMNSFNFAVEQKERQVQFLMRAIEDADEQHRRAFQAHNETLSNFIGIGTQRLNRLQTNYEQQKNNYLETWEKEEMDMNDRQERAEFKLKLIMFIMNRNFQKYRAENELKRATAKSDLILEFEEDMRNLWKPKQLEIEQYWTQLREVYNSYLEQHNPIMSHYNSLKEKDDYYQKDIAKNEVLIQQAQEQIKTLQTEWTNTTNKITNKVKRMNKHKEQLAAKYLQMKNDDKAQRKEDDDKLVLMVNCSQDTIKRIESLKEKLDKIISLAEICRKYETEDDLLRIKEIENSKTPIEYENLDEDMVEECKDYKKMNKFMTKMNNAQVQILCLKAEKTKLAKENQKITQYLKKYLTEMALSEGQKRPQSMKIHSGIQKIDGAGKVLNRPVTCIEGATSIAVMHEKRMALERRNQEKAAIRSYPRIQCWMKAV